MRVFGDIILLVAISLMISTVGATASDDNPWRMKSWQETEPYDLRIERNPSADRPARGRQNSFPQQTGKDDQRRSKTNKQPRDYYGYAGPQQDGFGYRAPRGRNSFVGTAKRKSSGRFGAFPPSGPNGRGNGNVEDGRDIRYKGRIFGAFPPLNNRQNKQKQTEQRAYQGQNSSVPRAGVPRFKNQLPQPVPPAVRQRTYNGYGGYGTMMIRPPDPLGLPANPGLPGLSGPMPSW